MKEIELTNVTKRIGRHTVIEDASVLFKPGTIVGLKGINGSGKTMLMRLISGLIKPTSGTIRIGDKMLGRELSFPESIGMLLENPAFLDAYSGLENLKILASIKGRIGVDQVKQSIATLGLDPDDTKKYRKYSLGMKQRLGIAAAVMEEPEIIILDEPTNSLDTDGVQIVKDVVTRERNRGALIILASHEYDVLHFLSDEIIEIEKGRIVDQRKVIKDE